MTAQQRISSSIKRRRENSQSMEKGMEHIDEGQQILEQAKNYLATAASKNISLEAMGMLRSLCDVLEGSLSNSKQQQQQGSGANTPINYGTWGAIAPQGQRQRRVLMSKLAASREEKKSELPPAMTAAEMDTIREEEHNEQPTIGSDSRMDAGGSPGSSSRRMSAGKLEGMQELSGDIPASFFVGEEEQSEPLSVRLLPLLALALSALLYLLFGSVFFRWIDPEIRAKSWPRAFIWSFQLLATIGWGDTHASNTLSQAFTVFYVVFGVSIFFSLLANLGRLLTEFCCRFWPIIRRRLFERRKDANAIESTDEEENVQRLPIMVIANLLVLHQLLGLFIYSCWLKDWPIIATLYFSITTLATSGFGDYHPDTDSWLETSIAVLYLSTGIILLSALFLIISLYYQTFHHIHLKTGIGRFHARVGQKWTQLRQKGTKVQK